MPRRSRYNLRSHNKRSKPNPSDNEYESSNESESEQMAQTTSQTTNSLDALKASKAKKSLIASLPPLEDPMANNNNKNQSTVQSDDDSDIVPFNPLPYPLPKAPKKKKKGKKKKESNKQISTRALMDKKRYAIANTEEMVVDASHIFSVTETLKVYVRDPTKARDLINFIKNAMRRQGHLYEHPHGLVGRYSTQWTACENEILRIDLAFLFDWGTELGYDKSMLPWSSGNVAIAWRVHHGLINIEELDVTLRSLLNPRDSKSLSDRMCLIWKHRDARKIDKLSANIVYELKKLGAGKASSDLGGSSSVSAAFEKSDRQKLINKNKREYRKYHSGTKALLGQCLNSITSLTNQMASNNNNNNSNSNNKENEEKQAGDFLDSLLNKNEDKTEKVCKMTMFQDIMDCLTSSPLLSEQMKGQILTSVIEHRATWTEFIYQSKKQNKDNGTIILAMMMKMGYSLNKSE